MQKHLCKSNPNALNFLYICKGGYANVLLFNAVYLKRYITYKQRYWFSVVNVHFSLSTEDIGKTEAHVKRTTFTAHSHKTATDQLTTLILNKQKRLEPKPANAGSTDDTRL